MLNKKTYYFLKVILFFEFSTKESFSIKEISERLDISEKVLEQVLLALKNNGILSSKRGPQGGYRLTADTTELTVLDIIDIGGKKLDIFPLADDYKGNIIDAILEEVNADIAEKLARELKEVHIRQLAELMCKRVTEKGLTYNI